MLYNFAKYAGIELLVTPGGIKREVPSLYRGLLLWYVSRLTPPSNVLATTRGVSNCNY